MRMLLTFLRTILCVKIWLRFYESDATSYWQTRLLKRSQDKFQIGRWIFDSWYNDLLVFCKSTTLLLVDAAHAMAVSVIQKLSAEFVLKHIWNICRHSLHEKCITSCCAMRQRTNSNAYQKHDLFRSHLPWNQIPRRLAATDSLQLLLLKFWHCAIFFCDCWESWYSIRTQEVAQSTSSWLLHDIDRNTCWTSRRAVHSGTCCAQPCVHEVFLHVVPPCERQ